MSHNYTSKFNNIYKNTKYINKINAIIYKWIGFRIS